MASVTILKKHVTHARRAARKDSTARVDGRSIFIKRYPGNNYKIIMVHVTQKQRAVRDMFADANALAKNDMSRWNRVRHWKRYARKHHKLGAYRAAVSYYYSLIRKHSEQLQELFHDKNSGRLAARPVRYTLPAYSAYSPCPKTQDMRVFQDGTSFFWLKFNSAEEYRSAILRFAS